MKLKEFQLQAVNSLFEAMEKPARDIVLKSPTGSGKTIILTYFMHQYIQSFPKTVFVWLTPGKGNLEEQSKEKMDKYIHASQMKTLNPIILKELIEKIEVYHVEGSGKNKTQRIVIHYRFVGCLTIPEWYRKRRVSLESRSGVEVNFLTTAV